MDLLNEIAVMLLECFNVEFMVTVVIPVLSVSFN